MKIYVFGGSFDPPHRAHIEIVKHVISDCEKLYIFPAKKSPNKVEQTVATSDQRLQMCNLSFQAISSKIEVSDFELNSPLPSYTINTVDWILEQFQDCEVSIIIGEDQASQLDSWYEFELLKEKVNFICFSRNRFDLKSQICLEYIQNFNHDISSTELRMGFPHNLEELKLKIHPEVIDYIQLNKLYSC